MSVQSGVHAETSMRSLLTRGAIGGIVAGMVFAVANMWFASSNGMPAIMPLKTIASIVQGAPAAMDGSASPLIGVLVHIVLSIAFGIGLALVARALPAPGPIAVAALVYGAALYVVNFLILAPLFFEAFTMANQPFEAVAHVVYAAVVLPFLLHFERADVGGARR
jgi:uncharacterized membrane protein YagU involved in acid resistance